MANLAAVYLAEYGGLKGLALLGLCVVAFLYWEEIKEKRTRRRERRELEERRRQKEAQNR